MLIGIDGNEANVKNRVGIGQYAYNALKHLYKKDHENHYFIYLKNPPLPDLPQPSTKWHYKVFGPQKLWTKFALPLTLYTQKEKLNLFFSLGHYSPHFCPFPTICSIMDLSYIKYPEQFTKKDLYQLTNWTKNSINNSKHIITISEFSKQEIVNFHHIDPSKITVAYPGVSPPKKISNYYPLDTNYFLYLGTLKPNKNIPFLIESFSNFHSTNQNFKLIIAGKKGWLFNEIFKTIKKLNLEQQIIFTDYITESKKWALLKKAKALIIPSLYEGFGIPAIEAMSVGTPVIASNTSCLPEIVGKAGILIDPTKKKQLTQAMFEVLKPKIKQNLTKLGLLQASRFTWNNTVNSILKAFDKV